MSYSIHYGPDKPNGIRNTESRLGLIGAIVVVLVCVLAIGWAIPEHTEQFVQALFPWAREEVRSALDEMRLNLKAGQPVRDVISAFCQGIISEASGM